MPTNEPMQPFANWPRGPMDKASAYGAGDCRFESCRGHFGDEESLEERSRKEKSERSDSLGVTQPERREHHGHSFASGSTRRSQEPPVGIEPTTIRLRSACSTN